MIAGLFEKYPAYPASPSGGVTTHGGTAFTGTTDIHALVIAAVVMVVVGLAMIFVARRRSLR